MDLQQKLAMDNRAFPYYILVCRNGLYYLLRPPSAFHNTYKFKRPADRLCLLIVHNGRKIHDAFKANLEDGWGHGTGHRRSVRAGLQLVITSAKVIWAWIHPLVLVGMYIQAAVPNTVFDWETYTLLCLTLLWLHGRKLCYSEVWNTTGIEGKKKIYFCISW